MAFWERDDGGMKMWLLCILMWGGGGPDMPGFNRSGSDAKAIEIAEQVMISMGGYEAWDKTRYLRWKFFGKRGHVWDKWTGRVRVESKDTVILMNVVDRRGQAYREGVALAGEELEKALQHGFEAWINDAYWVVMPYKLKDSGVTLKYVGEGELASGRQADVLELTFAGVGVTPENKYHVMVARDTGLVESWSFFATASDDEPRFTTPWANWRSYGQIMLSDDRGEAKHTDLAVFESLPDSVFEDPAPLDWESIEQ